MVHFRDKYVPVMGQRALAFWRFAHRGIGRWPMGRGKTAAPRYLTSDLRIRILDL